MLVSSFLGVFSVGCSLCSFLCLGVCVHGPLCCSLCFAGLFLGFFGSFLPLFVFVGTLAWFGAFASALWCGSIVTSPQAVPFYVCVRIWCEHLVFYPIFVVCVLYSFCVGGVPHVYVCVLVDFGRRLTFSSLPFGHFD